MNCLIRVHRLILVLLAAVMLPITIEGQHIPHLFTHKNKQKDKLGAPLAGDGAYKNSVVHSNTVRKWSSSPVFEGRPKWNPILSELIKRYLSSQAKSSLKTKTNKFNSFVGAFNELSKQSRIAKGVESKTFHKKPSTKLVFPSLKYDKKTTGWKPVRRLRNRLKQRMKFKHKASLRNRRDIAAIALTAGEEDQVLDPFDVNDHLLRWEHSNLGVPGHYSSREKSFVDYTKGHYSPLYRNRFGTTYHSVLNTNSVGFSGDFFGDDITNGWYRKKRSTIKKSRREKRSAYDKGYGDYGFSHLSDMDDSFNSYSDSMKDNTYGHPTMDNGHGLLYPLDSDNYYGMVYKPRYKTNEEPRRRYRKPSAKHVGVDYAFGQQYGKTNSNKSPKFQFSNFRDPTVVSSQYGSYPINKKDDVYSGGLYDFGKFKTSDSVFGTDYGALNMLPVGRVGYVGQNSGSNRRNTALSASGRTPLAADPPPTRPKASPKAVVPKAAIRSTKPPVVTTRAPITKPPVTTQTLPKTTVFKKPSCCDECGYGRHPKDHTTTRDPCYPYAGGTTPATHVSTTPCYTKHQPHQTTPHYHPNSHQNTPHYHPHSQQTNPHYHPHHVGRTQSPYQATTPKSIWSEFEIIANVDSWLGTSRSPRGYDKMRMKHQHKYIDRQRTTSNPYNTTPMPSIVSRIVTQNPGTYKYNYTQDIDIKVQHHPNGQPRITGTVELQHDGDKAPRFVVKLPFAAGKLPLSIRKLIISRFTPSPLDSGKSAVVNSDFDCAPWNTTCMQEYADRMRLQGDIDVIAELDPSLIDGGHLRQGLDHINDLRDAEERNKAYENEFDFSPEVLPEIGDDGKVSEIHSSVPVHDAYFKTEHWKDPHLTKSDDEASAQQLHDDYQQKWLSVTTASPLRVKLNSLPSATPKWLRDIITKFVGSTENVKEQVSGRGRPRAMFQRGPVSSGSSTKSQPGLLFAVVWVFAVQMVMMTL